MEPGCPIPAPFLFRLGAWGLRAGNRIPDAGCRMPVAGRRSPVADMNQENKPWRGDRFVLRREPQRTAATCLSPLRGLVILFHRDPGAHAPGYISVAASRLLTRLHGGQLLRNQNSFDPGTERGPDLEKQGDADQTRLVRRIRCCALLFPTVRARRADHDRGGISCPR